jgi:formylglycine-generating enzyme
MKARDGMTPEQAVEIQKRRWANQAHLGDIHLQVSLELGRKQMMLSEVQQIKEQDVIELEKLAGEAFEIRANDHVFALGEIVAVADVMACRVTELRHPVSSEEFNRPLEFARPEATPSDQQAENSEIEGMIYIPGGSFVMGSDLSGHDDENPEHQIHLSAYFIGKFPVTNLEYREFIQSTGHLAPVHWRNGTYPDLSKANHPVTHVAWQDACDYAEWFGARLPTEVEWERAARGDRGNEYPWGKSCFPDFTNFASPRGGTSPVDKYPRGVSEYGVWDMCGNVGEWVRDWYDAQYYTRSPESNPTGPEEGEQKVYRGGGYHANRMDIRAAARHFSIPTDHQPYIGFRIAMDA